MKLINPLENIRSPYCPGADRNTERAAEVTYWHILKVPERPIVNLPRIKIYSPYLRLFDVNRHGVSGRTPSRARPVTPSLVRVVAAGENIGAFRTSVMITGSLDQYLPLSAHDHEKARSEG